MNDDSHGACVVLCTCPDAETAQRLAAGLVERRLAACVNVLGGVRSIYRWQGEVQDDAEILLLVKTTEQRLDELRQWINAEHPYEMPEVVALPVSGGSANYLDWLAGSVRN